MPDSTGAEQDGAATVDKARFDGLMSSFQKEKARADALEAKFGGLGDAGSSDDGSAGSDGEDHIDAAGDSQQTSQVEYEDGGQYEFDAATGSFVPYEPPTPQDPNASGSGRDSQSREPTIAQLRARLDQQVGKPSRSGTQTWDHLTD
jgi:hypothetical protein